ncbi:hypothetical protein JCM11641_008014 [Rhodosporidiobolus odoratus]
MVGRPKGPVWDHFEFLTEDLIVPGKTTPIKAKAAQLTWAWCKGLYREKARQLKAEHRKKRVDSDNTVTGAEWGEGRAVMSLEEICFEGVSEEGRPVETVERVVAQTLI